MKLQKIFRIIGYSLLVIVFFSGAIFLSASFALFTFSTSSVNTTLDSLQSSSSNFNVSLDPSFPYGRGTAPYYISPTSVCNQYDEDFNCIEPVPDLCPYLSLQPKDGESTEIGFNQNKFNTKARGQLNNPSIIDEDDPPTDPIDTTDAWTLSVNSPCFEGECPAGYNPLQKGDPLPQSLKGKIFKCNLEVQAADLPPLVQNYLKQNTAYADNPSTVIEVSATLTGEVAGCTTDCNSNVLFLPGLESSRLYMIKANGSEEQLWEPSGFSDTEALYLNANGTPRNPTIYTRDIIKESNTPIPTGPAGLNIYKSFANTMDQLVSDQKIKEWQPFAYDWRESIQDIVNTPQKYNGGQDVSLIGMLKALQKSSKNGKVTIIAHSNGGLVAKALLKKLQDDKNAGTSNLIDKVDVLILVAVPEIGTASAVPAIIHGYDQAIVGGLLMDEVHARELGRNMPSAYGVLPSKEYINHVSASPATFVDNAIPSNVTTKMVQKFGSAIDSYNEYEDFLFGNEGRTNPPIDQTNLPISLSESLFSQAESLHNSIDAWTPPPTMRVIEVAGWGEDTVASFEYYPRVDTDCGVCNSLVLDERPRFTADGDGTVVVPSAQYTSFLGGAEKYWLNLPLYNKGFTKDREHKDILEVVPLLNFIPNILESKPNTDTTYLTTVTPVDISNHLRLSIHSPVTLDAYDASGNHTGKVCPPNSDFCYAEENIPNSSYIEFGEGKYLNIPEDQAKSIKLQGTDVGTFTYDSDKVLPNGTSTTSSFVDIPVTTQTQAEVVLNTSGTPQLNLDVTGDGVTDFTLSPSSTFDPITYLNVMKATIDSLDIPAAKIKAFDTRVDNIIKLIQKRKIDKAKLKADKFKSVLEKKLAKPDPKHPKIKKLSKTDAQLLLDMLNKLLDNLS